MTIATTEIPKSWQCGGCGKWKAPHVEECGCQQSAAPACPGEIPYVAPPTLPPVQPWPTIRPWWEAPWCGPVTISRTTDTTAAPNVQIMN